MCIRAQLNVPLSPAKSLLFVAQASPTSVPVEQVDLAHCDFERVQPPPLPPPLSLVVDFHVGGPSCGGHHHGLKWKCVEFLVVRDFFLGEANIYYFRNSTTVARTYAPKSCGHRHAPCTWSNPEYVLQRKLLGPRDAIP